MISIIISDAPSRGRPKKLLILRIAKSGIKKRGWIILEWKQLGGLERLKDSRGQGNPIQQRF